MALKEWAPALKVTRRLESRADSRSRPSRPSWSALRGKLPRCDFALPSRPATPLLFSLLLRHACLVLFFSCLHSPSSRYCLSFDHGPSTTTQILQHLHSCSSSTCAHPEHAKNRSRCVIGTIVVPDQNSRMRSLHRQHSHPSLGGDNTYPSRRASVSSSRTWPTTWFHPRIKTRALRPRCLTSNVALAPRTS